ncbi:putative UDP-N-acetylglucosamine-peptide N-acetylglucosaminyltransferase [Tribonema minus]|uniref:protein O-GlcNAc transferase n=1 Tax=Tribonema minus TaxID=303371 RepID=A0A835ZDI7_9STRA|nr:putative UDP-N-acetylglucosamine-peptide N-acetylglucosaminyltransferase [Tribonema minus]
MQAAHQQYELGNYTDAQATCEAIYAEDAHRTDNLLLLGAVHFQLRNFSECIFYNQQCIRVDPGFAEAYSNLGNALKELGDINGAVQFYVKAIKLKPRFCDAYNNLASAQMQLGQAQEAIETYQMALLLQPTLVDAHSNLGNLYKAKGMMEEAKACYLEAIRIRPDFAIPWSNLAGIMKEEGQLATAVAYYKEAIRLAPEFADAHSNLGNVLKEQGRLDDAMACYRAAIALRPDFAIAHGNLASCYFDMGELAQATAAFKHAIQLEPNFPDAYNNLGNALREQGELEPAVACYRTALQLKPDHPHAYNNLGNAMKDKGLVREAIHCYVTAIRLMPRFAAAHSNLGSVLKEQGKLEQALAHYGEAIDIDPLFADAYSNMGNAYKDLGRLSDAVRCYCAAIKIRPGFADAYSNLASAYKDGGHVAEAIGCYRKALALKPDFPDAFANLVHSLNFICDWSTRDADFAQLTAIIRRQVAAPAADAADTAVAAALPSVQPFHALVYPLGLADMLEISRRYAQRARLNVRLLDLPPFRHRARAAAGAAGGGGNGGGRLRVGYVSSDLGNHPLSHLMQSVFGMHDKSRFQVTCYALSANDNSVWRQKIEAEVEQMRDISALQPGDAARLIHADGIDVLINLNGYTKGARNEIFALQPAPVQVAYMGFCGTMGADFIQYMVADREVIPPEARTHYTEALLYMPHSYFVNDHRQSARFALEAGAGGAPALTRAQYGVPDDKFVFCNFNQIYKIDPDTFDIWMRVLRRVPNSILWLLRFPPAGEANIRAEAHKRGVTDAQLHFTNVAPKEEHIRRGALADLCLDTLSCNAHTTGCDILWSGTPMLTARGIKMASRVGASLLKAAGLPELVAGSVEEYEEAAVALATEPERLFALRQRLAAARRGAPLFDTQRWVRSFEAGLERVYAAHQQQQQRLRGGYGGSGIGISRASALAAAVARRALQLQ